MSVVVIREVKIRIGNDPDEAMGKCHVHADLFGDATLCGLRSPFHGVAMPFVTSHQNGRCHACGKPTCLTCDLLAGVNVTKGDNHEISDHG